MHSSGTVWGNMEIQQQIGHVSKDHPSAEGLSTTCFIIKLSAGASKFSSAVSASVNWSWLTTISSWSKQSQVHGNITCHLRLHAYWKERKGDVDDRNVGRKKRERKGRLSLIRPEMRHLAQELVSASGTHCPTHEITWDQLKEGRL